MERVFSGLVLAMTSLFCQAQPVPDFQLRDENFNSPRGGQIVSPRDYKMQITAVYFGEAGCGGCRTQFAELQKMQNTVNALNTDLKIEIIGVNHKDHQAYNNLMIEGKTMPWLQDTPEHNVWESWGVDPVENLRDLRILNARNELIQNYNLVVNDLRIPGNAALLKQILTNAAAAVDTDSDKLLDAWELEQFENLDSTASMDSDNDGVDNFHEFAFGTNPTDAASRAEIFKAVTAQDTFIFSFRRQAGSLINYFIETSTDLQAWDDSLDHFIFGGPPRTLFDGTGTAEVVCTLSKPVTEAKAQFVRIRAVPKN